MGMTRCLIDSGGACFIANLTNLRSDSPTNVNALQVTGQYSKTGGRGEGLTVQSCRLERYVRHDGGRSQWNEASRS